MAASASSEGLQQDLLVPLIVMPSASLVTESASNCEVSSARVAMYFFHLGKGGEEDEPEVATMMTARLSGDRTVVDEEVAARWMQVFKNYAENPKQMVL